MLAGPQATRMLSDIQKDEIRTAVPALAAAFDGRPCAQPTRPIISGPVLKSFQERHQKNDVLVVEETFFNTQTRVKMHRRWVYNPPLTTLRIPYQRGHAIKSMRHF